MPTTTTTKIQQQQQPLGPISFSWSRMLTVLYLTSSGLHGWTISRGPGASCFMLFKYQMDTQPIYPYSLTVVDRKFDHTEGPIPASEITDNGNAQWEIGAPMYFF